MDNEDSNNHTKRAGINQELSYAIFKANSLKEDPLCIQSTLDHYVAHKRYNIYSNQSLLRVLAKRVNLLTKDLTDIIFDSSKNNELTVVLNWKNGVYTYVTLDLTVSDHAQYLSENQDELLSYFQSLLEVNL